MAKENRPWDQIAGEGDKAFAAFRVYRDMGASRTVAEASAVVFPPKPGAERKMKTIGIIAKWSSQHQWRSRARAWDKELDRLALAEQARDIVKMNRRHADEAVILQEKALERLRRMNPDEMSPTDALRFIVEAAKLERTALGVAEKIEKVQIQVQMPDEEDLVEQTPDQVAEILSILANAGIVHKPGEHNPKPLTGPDPNIIDVELL